jgi:heme-degrading monooxygenase HmoA
VTISVWDSAAAAKAWARHPEHLEAQGRGRRDYYAEFTMYVCDEARVRVSRPVASEATTGP